MVDTLLTAPGTGAYGLRVHFLTANGVVGAADDVELQRAFETGWLLATDGMPLVWLAKLRGVEAERVCGPDVLPALADRGRALGRRHYFYGGAPGVAETLAECLREQFPGIEICGTASPPFRPLSDEEDAADVAAINAARPDYLWVGLGSPKQEHWLAQHADRLEVPVLLAVGAAFDFHAGVVARAPGVLQKTGLEWVHRLFAEPGRLWRRYTVTNVQFVWLALWDTVGWILRRGVSDGTPV
jgi:N-acetylglucosaminyldiphosphoundecaprenol N-acetyl-beta-D-mannosaminyltransferase